MERIKMTKNTISSLPDTVKRYGDEDCKTLQLWTGRRGKVFYFVKKHKGKKIEKRLGAYPDFTREMAVDRCNEYNVNLAKFDALEPGQGKSNRYVTVKEAFEHYTKIKKPNRNFLNLWRAYLLPFDSKYIKDLQKSEVKNLHLEISRTAPVMANRVISSLKAVINLAINDELYIGGNPAAKIRKNEEKPRTRYLMPSEMPRVIETLESMRKQPRRRSGAESLLLLLYTGQRRSNVLQMEWSEINELNIWTIPAEKAKSRKNIVVTLTDETAEILNSRKNNGSRYVFPAPNNNNKPLGDIKKTWHSVCRLCGVENAHIHDLRHTNATYQLFAGADIATVSENLGHANINITKQVYAHVMTEKKREAANNAIRAMRQGLNAVETGKETE